MTLEEKIQQFTQMQIQKGRSPAELQQFLTTKVGGGTGGDTGGGLSSSFTREWAIREIQRNPKQQAAITAMWKMANPEEEEEKETAAEESLRMGKVGAERIVSELEDIYFTKDGTPKFAYGRAGGTLQMALAAAGYNADLKTYLNARTSVRPRLAKAFGDVGNLSLPEQQSAVKLLPTGFSTPEEAVKGFSRIRNMLGLEPKEVLEEGAEKGVPSPMAQQAAGAVLPGLGPFGAAAGLLPEKALGAIPTAAGTTGALLGGGGIGGGLGAGSGELIRQLAMMSRGKGGLDMGKVGTAGLTGATLGGLYKGAVGKLSGLGGKKAIGKLAEKGMGVAQEAGTRSMPYLPGIEQAAKGELKSQVGRKAVSGAGWQEAMGRLGEQTAGVTEKFGKHPSWMDVLQESRGLFGKGPAEEAWRRAATQGLGEVAPAFTSTQEALAQLYKNKQLLSKLGRGALSVGRNVLPPWLIGRSLLGGR